MDLIWLDSNPNQKPDEFPDEHRQSSYHIEIFDDHQPESARLRVTFDRFGRGEQRRPSFAVELNWLDVRRYVAEYMKLDHPEAAYIRRVLALVEAIEGAGWPPANPPPAEFYDDHFPPPPE